MKKFLVAIFALVCSVSMFGADAKVFDLKEYNKIAKEKGWDAAREYTISCTDFSKNPYFAFTRAGFIVSKLMRGKDQAISYDTYKAEVLKLCSNYKPTESALAYSYLSSCFMLNKFSMEDGIKFGNTNLVGTQFEKSFYILIAQKYIYNVCGIPKDYAKAIEWADKAEEQGLLVKFNACYQARDRKNTWETGVIYLLDDYRTPSDAMAILKKMFNRKPSDLPEQQVVEFLTDLADKYPTPGSNFDEWKGFMGFVGYKYKAITGKDLFKSDTQAATK